jgi:hypothetical protein
MSLSNTLRMSKVAGQMFGQKISVPVGVVAVALAVTATQATASTGSGSWSSQPSWANSDNAPPPRKASYARESRYSQVSPFSPGSNNVALDVGQVFLMGDLGSNYSDSIGAQIHYTYGVSELFGFDSSIGYSDHSDGRFSMTTLLTGLRTNLAWYDKVVPYLTFGLGFYRPSYTETLTTLTGATSESLSPLLFGVHLGPGVDLELTKQLFFGAALTFHDVFGSRRALPSGTPVNAGGTYTSFLLHAGVTF